ncbi:unnamed protein product [Nippostrongylus brasiliensis]|uniref:G_PROTEIN_RECEP_F1_2 domain-containing protein n=1 Tax=Nippostrongylus brasiliensis TaxID=27835 RepID=A0A158R2R4_NIPBR|nr:unnamed protein product [Nippostrongylus brasiliensis]
MVLAVFVVSNRTVRRDGILISVGVHTHRLGCARISDHILSETWPNEHGPCECRPVYADENWWKIYNIYLTIIHYFVPMIILDTAYSMIAIKIWGSTISRGEESQNLNQSSLNTEISNRKSALLPNVIALSQERERVLERLTKYDGNALTKSADGAKGANF